MNEAATPTAPADVPATGNRRRILLTITFVLLLLAAGWTVLEVLVLSKREKTDDAYVTGNQIRVSSQIAGIVVEVFARNTSRVEPGQKLLRLDDADARQALERAAANLAQTVRQVRQQTAQSVQFDAQIAGRELELQQAEEDLRQREPLLAEQAVAGEEVRHARNAVALARTALRQSQQQSAAARALVDHVSLEQNPSVLAAVAAYKDAWLHTQRSIIVAPAGGYIAQRSVQLGQRIAPGEPLMSIIALQDVWLEANFKEKQLRNLRIGQPAEIETDVYGGDVVFHGRIIGLSAGTGAAFSLLPPQNASGNWIKITQRVPVKIALDPRELAAHPLRIGLSTTTTIDTHDRDGAVLAVDPVSDVHESTLSYVHDPVTAEQEALKIIRANSGGN
uniref:Membrane fusion component of tripartite multidrug resistance system n=1 Tax=uncultured bacterium BLR2 TaxID=506520 RepID=B5L5U6_9BACT|nr:membrane fusion component of tripartite multidrug resistance system [uncultured bacterium BLR2]